MSNPSPVGLGPDEEERVARFRYGRFAEETGLPTWDQLTPRHRKIGRREAREIVDALRACGYRVERVDHGEDSARITSKAFGVDPVAATS